MHGLIKDAIPTLCKNKRVNISRLRMCNLHLRAVYAISWKPYNQKSCQELLIANSPEMKTGKCDQSRKQ